ncbi:Secologanin synthase [Hordeum vulgare]|nr:Secologanin synthase [Hordeum vulgare]
MALPLARFLTCKEKVHMYISTIEKHDRWVFYKCHKHGVTCDFWWWELGYVEYLVDKHYVSGDAVVDAIGAAEERREELLKAQELFHMNGFVNLGKMVLQNDSGNLMSWQQVVALMMLGKELVMLMKMLVAIVVLQGLAALVLIMLKK